MGSGWLLDDQTVVTCAHNVYDHDNRAFAVSVMVMIGLNEKDARMATQRETRWGQSVAINYGYYAARQTRHDLAMIKLAKPFQHGSSIAWRDCPDKINMTVRVVGYPGDLGRPKGSQMHFSECLTGVCKLSQQEYKLQYMLDTEGGKGFPLRVLVNTID